MAFGFLSILLAGCQYRLSSSGSGSKITVNDMKKMGAVGIFFCHKCHHNKSHTVKEEVPLFLYFYEDIPDSKKLHLYKQQQKLLHYWPQVIQYTSIGC
jgi:hypothetical protein